MNLELQDPDQAFLDFGVVAVGSEVLKTVPLINRTKKPITFQLLPDNAEIFKKCCLSFLPVEEQTLKPKGVLNVQVKYNPKTRMPMFNQDLLLQIKDNEAKKLLQMQGVSHGIEIKLMEEVVAFAGVVKGSRMTKMLQMANFGDVKVQFKWDAKVYQKHFTIKPESGYIQPNSNLDLEVTFHPKEVDSDIKYEKVKCEIKGGEPQHLTLLGKCVEQEEGTQAPVQFNAMVRKTVKQTVAVANSEDKEWTINPSISTEAEECKGYFIGKPTLTVPPKGTAQYEITYQPKTMTKKDSEGN